MTIYKTNPLAYWQIVVIPEPTVVAPVKTPRKWRKGEEDAKQSR